MYNEHQILAIAILFCTLAWVTVSLRVYVRGLLMKTWGLDDSFMCACLVGFTGYLSCQFLAAAHGNGKHRWEISKEDYRMALKAWFFGELIYVGANCFLKLSISFFYLRIAQKPWHIWIIRMLMASNVCFCIAYFFIVMFQCMPISEFWNNHPASAKCFPRDFTIGITFGIGSLNAAADWTLGLLPFAIVWDLKMARKTKVLVAAILAFAAIGSTGTVVRLFYIPTVMNGEDFLWATTGVALWTTVEVGIGITAGSVATLRPLWRQVMSWKNTQSKEPRKSRTASSREKRRPGFRRSMSPSDLVPAHFTGTTAATLKSYASKSSSEAMYYDDMVLSPLKSPPIKEEEIEDEEAEWDRVILPAHNSLHDLGGWENDAHDDQHREDHERRRAAQHPEYPDLETGRLEGPPRVHLRDSFRNSLNFGTILSAGRWRLPD